MKKILFLTLCLFYLVTNTSFARELIILNDCDFPLTSIKLGIAGNDKGYDILKTPLKSQEAVKIHVNDKDKLWTIQFEDPDASLVTLTNIDFKGIRQVHINNDGIIEIYRRITSQ